MTILALAKSTSKLDVELAWATYRALIIAEADDPRLQDDETHQRAISLALRRFQSMYSDWAGQ